MNSNNPKTEYSWFLIILFPLWWLALPILALFGIGAAGKVADDWGKTSKVTKALLITVLVGIVVFPISMIGLGAYLESQEDNQPAVTQSVDNWSQTHQQNPEEERQAIAKLIDSQRRH